MRGIDLSGKVALVLGVANKRSLAWAIADALGEAGCSLALTYQGERLRKNVDELAQKYPGAPVMACDVESDEQVEGVFARVEKDYGRLDVLVHSIAYARREDLEGEFLKTSRQGWRIAMEISAFSFIRLTSLAVPFMKNGGSVMALTYVASQRVVPNYNVMGSAKAALEHAVRQLASELGPSNIRVNAISAGPISTLSARGIKGFSGMASHHRRLAPLRRNIEPREVGDAALFLASEMASGITGEVVHVDGGFNIMAI
ncbi:MAG: SDR family oxidoreductase [Acidobacteria bacterium]|nr:SDR family oxidoreductase [Acidobacteriota bacterium]NIM64311.1 SDR family oxidoreductase [Acidobacteriota bacterium]NIQ84954.1 SDR family oxidoreductase [Acidobacteriota bacterium]NIT10768.1 SDR family oxidoreductase [Acidobacteriota bacterium]